MFNIELKPGYLVRLRNGKLYMVMHTERNVVLASEPFETAKTDSAWVSLALYDQDFKFSDDNCREYDIMEIYGHNRYAYSVFRFSTDNRTLLWKRNEKKRYTYAQLREILGEEFEVVG